MDFSVAVSIVVRNNQVLLVQRSLKENGLLNWQFPAGKLEKDEDPLNAAEREVYEETGIQCKALEKIGKRTHPLTEVLIHYIACDYIGGTEKIKNNREVKSIKWVKPLDLLAYIPNFLYPGIKEYFEEKNLW